MLDGNRYYKAFPDERPTLSSLQALLDILERLEAEFRRYLQSGENEGGLILNAPDLPGCAGDDQGENDRSLIRSDTKTRQLNQASAVRSSSS